MAGERLPGERLPAVTPADLTPREREVVALLAAGLPRKAVAARLGISPNTVRNHIATIFARTRSSSVTSLIAWWHGWRAYAEGEGAPPPLDWSLVDYTPALAAAVMREVEARLYRLPPHYCNGKRFVHLAGVLQALRHLLTGASQPPGGEG
jgi:DNA-binding CsgD family transcriptional regulator